MNTKIFITTATVLFGIFNVSFAAHKEWAIVRMSDKLREHCGIAFRNLDACEASKPARVDRPWPFFLAEDSPQDIFKVHSTVSELTNTMIDYDRSNINNIEAYLHGFDSQNGEAFEELAKKLGVSLDFIPPLTKEERNLQEKYVMPLRSIIEQQLREEEVDFAPQNPANRTLKNWSGCPLEYPYNAVHDDLVVLKQARATIMEITGLSSGYIGGTQQKNLDEIVEYLLRWNKNAFSLVTKYIQDNIINQSTTD